MAQLAFKRAKFYFWIQNDRLKGRMSPNDVIYSSSLQLLDKYLVLRFLTFRIINNRRKECQIFLQ